MFFIFIFKVKHNMAPEYVKKLFKSIRNKYCTQSSYHNYHKQHIFQFQVEDHLYGTIA